MADWNITLSCGSLRRPSNSIRKRWKMGYVEELVLENVILVLHSPIWSYVLAQEDVRLAFEHG